MTAAPPSDQPLIVFDGLCGLCSASAEFVLKHDRRRVFMLTTAQSPIGRDIYLRNNLDPDAMSTMIVIADGAVHTESDAVLKVLARIGWPWRAAAVARIVPRALRNRMYRWIARNRYRLAKPRETCWLGTDAVRDRIL